MRIRETNASLKIGEHTCRTVPLEDTEAMVRSCMRRVPITRVTDLTPLDRLRLPVFGATTPLAHDLTTHMGKGADARSARISALMEAVERVSAERISASTIRTSFNRLSVDHPDLVDPAAFDLPNDSAYSPDREITWTEATSLHDESTTWVPVDLVTSPPTENIIKQVDTNGLASGNTLLEAVVHAVCEIVERDAAGLALFRAMYADSSRHESISARIDPESLPAVCSIWMDRIEESGQSLQIEQLPTDVGIAVFKCVLVDEQYPAKTGYAPRRFVGFGSAPCATLAVLRSIAESVQSRVAIVQGARDSFNALSANRERSSLKRENSGASVVPFSAVPSFEARSLDEDLDYLLLRLSDAGFDRVLVANLTRPEFGVPVVRVRVPGLSSFLVDRRRIGWRCRRLLL